MEGKYKNISLEMLAERAKNWSAFTDRWLDKRVYIDMLLG